MSETPRYYVPHSSVWPIVGSVALFITAYGAANYIQQSTVKVTTATGSVAGIACFWATYTVKRILHIDDSLDVFPVHGIGGIIGTLLTGVFVGVLGGAGLAEGVTVGRQVGIQFVGVIATIIWCAVVSLVIFKLLDITIGLRVTEEQETEGLDLTLHDEKGYNW